MMNPREKALLLCQKMGWTSFSNIEMDNATLPIDVAKKCASIAVVELIDEWQQALKISFTAYSRHKQGSGTALSPIKDSKEDLNMTIKDSPFDTSTQQLIDLFAALNEQLHYWQEVKKELDKI
ncbi:MAG: hypothetical protein IPP29_12015 [Bacteroidetes bacterium]|nr:hypothetical protein [Bacteroidota bacterium]